jgi:hypothetical protein
MATPDEFATDHVAAFNDAVVRRDFDGFVARFGDDAIVRFENVPGAGTLEFDGLVAIAEAYREQPPDDQIDIAGRPGEEGATIVIPFAWHRDGGTGLMGIEREGELITRMTVAFARLP